MNEQRYERKGLGEDWFSHHWFCDVLRNAKRQLAEGHINEAEHTVAMASLYALERMDANALASALSVLEEVLASKGESLRDYLERGLDTPGRNSDEVEGGWNQAA